MDAVILAAGLGRGLEPLTHTKHKSLMPALDKTLLELQLESLKRVGVGRVTIVVSYLKEQVISKAREVAGKLDIEVTVVDQGTPLGTAHALNRALDYLTSDVVLVLYGDTFLEEGDIKRVVVGRGNIIGASRVDDPQKYGVLLVDKNSRLVKVIEKPAKAPSNLVNAGIYKLGREVLKYLREVTPSVRGEYELTDAINTAISEGVSIKVVELSVWFDIGRPWKLLELNKYLISKAVSKQVIKGRVESGVRIKGPVIVEDGAEVLQGTYVVGPAYIGKNCIVGPNAYIRPYTLLLSSCKIGFNVEVKESIIMEGTHASHQTYIGDSVIGEEVNLGAGTILANLRFDGRTVKVTVKEVREDSGRRKLGSLIGGHVKTGVNVSVNPGVKIGAYSWVYPGAVVREDIPPCSEVGYAGEVIGRVKDCGVDLSVWQ